MMNPDSIHDDAMHTVLHAWVTVYLRAGSSGVATALEPLSAQLQTQAVRLRESAVLLQAALEKMRLANERLAARMAEHKAFFAKYQAPQ